ncbi:ATP-NAD kinase [Durotheca rogersii]|uniref:ATP-NAD kinase n=1 Tax=Durotheca rogersii TaxID=419775 RepID=UPI0022200BB6|nr:ATP-NAD kinase [Durotheca rogersii]KAI5865239.1 ATP-NAD kinase [Durotheca rogersii]
MSLSNVSARCRCLLARRLRALRPFSTTSPRRELLDVSALPDRILPKYKENSASSLLSLQWPEPPRNILIIPKLHDPKVALSARSFASHIHSEYPNLNLVFERRVASSIQESLPFPIYTTSDPGQFPAKIDLVTTLGGDGTILRAASLFSLHTSVPPILSFSMGSLGFLGEWKFEEYKRAWREVYMSGSCVPVSDLQDPHTQVAAKGRADDNDGCLHHNWEGVRGKSMGLTRSSKILLRHRLKVGVYDAAGVNISEQLMPTSTTEPQLRIPPIPPGSEPASEEAGGRPAPRPFHAVNELVIHRGPNPHLAIIDVYVNNHFLTEAVADGILVSTPTGSTAYSLSAGGSIMHPLVKTLLITPICARSLSFRPLGLPLNTKVSLKLSKKNRGRELEVSIDGKRRAGVKIGVEIRVEGETVGRTPDGTWGGGVPCVIRSPGKGGGDRSGIAEDDDGWVGGLIGLLKFNYPFGEGQ